MKKIDCKTYSIYLNDWEAINRYVSQGNFSSILVLVDNNTFRCCLPIFRDKVTFHYKIIRIQSGEQHKNLTTCQFIWDKMIEHGADRHSLCINLGGGVIGDMGGFTASTFMRGMSFIQVPTTLLAQVDASVGGKLGIDYHNYKNLIGIILNPGAVFIFTKFLQTLDFRQILSGFAELLKHGLIRDKEVFERLVQIKIFATIEWEQLVYESVLLKKSITEEDPHERGVRKILNFGHTLGHAIESKALSVNFELLHGEAIAIGMVMEAHLSFQKGYLQYEEADYIKKRILAFYKYYQDIIPSLDELLSLMSKDKKNEAGKIRFSLLKEIGEGNYNEEVTPEEIGQAVRFYKA